MNLFQRLRFLLLIPGNFVEEDNFVEMPRSQVKLCGLIHMTKMWFDIPNITQKKGWNIMPKPRDTPEMLQTSTQCHMEARGTMVLRQ